VHEASLLQFMLVLTCQFIFFRLQKNPGH